MSSNDPKTRMPIATASAPVRRVDPRWIETLRDELATLTPTSGAPAIDRLTTRLAANALLPDAPRSAAFEATAYRRHLIAGGNDDAYSCLLIAWPAGHRTPIHDHDGLWGIELVLDGALEVQEFTIAGSPDAPRPTHTRSLMLGIGDAAVFTHRRYAHRCRNLSSTRAALSLHVYGGMLDRYRTFHADPHGHYNVRPHHALVEAALAV
jgi:predicted metal-dependent enzyme (double-stranded beta helix superfamily)